ncbi:MAG: hypothetical protein F6J87_04850 [Spirulina sp. SIO3F2]|nr:hypothetical protein [Spirulina sp. SIO3F2]
MSTHSSIPHALEVNSPPVWYRRPLFLGSILVGTMFGVSLWSYLAHPAWLGESDGTNVLVDRILQVNPGLSRSDLEQDIQLDNLSFWFGRSDQQYAGVATASTTEAAEVGEGSLLEQFMRGQESANQSEGESEGIAAATPAAAVIETGLETESESRRQTRSALDIALNGVDEQGSQALSPLQQALQEYQSEVNSATSAANAVEEHGQVAGSPINTTAGLNNTESIYENNTGLPTAGEPATGSSTRISRTADPTAVTEPIEVLPPRSRRPSNLPSFDPNAYRNTASSPTNTASQNQGIDSNQRRQFESSFTEQQGFNRVGAGQIESFANPLGTN